MSRSSENHLGASSSSPPFLQFGELSKEEECDDIAKKKKKAMIEQQQQKGMVEPDAPQMQGVAAQSSFNHSGPIADSESGIMSYAVLIILLVAAVIFGLDLGLDLGRGI